MLRSLVDCDIFRILAEAVKQKARRGSLGGAEPGYVGGGVLDGSRMLPLLYFTAGMKPTFSTMAWPAGLRVNSMNLAASPEGSPLV